jgi:dephospho-CoA kinase
MLKVGVTGGMGSGKTLVCRIFEVLGIPVYYADFHAKRLMESDPAIREELIRLFGPAVVKKGKIDREHLARIVFNNNDALRSVNSLVHPAVRKDFDGWMMEMSGCDYIIEEAAILFESGAYRMLDFNIAVSAPEEMRIKRIMIRDNTTRESVLSRLSNQMTENERNRLADAVILNDESELLIPQVIKMHKRILDIVNRKKQAAVP